MQGKTEEEASMITGGECGAVGGRCVWSASYDVDGEMVWTRRCEIPANCTDNNYISESLSPLKQEIIKLGVAVDDWSLDLRSNVINSITEFGVGMDNWSLDLRNNVVNNITGFGVSIDNWSLGLRSDVVAWLKNIS